MRGTLGETVTPCSAWCRPDEGIHAVLDWTWRNMDDLDEMRERHVGKVVCMTANNNGEGCLPTGTQTRCLSVEPAEVPPREGEWFCNPVLLTLQVVDR